MIHRTLVKLIHKRQLPDNFIFWVHYRWTVLLLVVLSFVVTCRLLFGESFICYRAHTSDFSQRYIDTKCYSDVVFTLPDKLFASKDSDTTPARYPTPEEYPRYANYYSWVNLLFLVHAFNFYLPHLLWKLYESGYTSRLTAGLETVGNKEDKRGMELCYLAKYVLVTQGKHRLYTSMYIFCEVLNYAIALSHTLWLVYFFDVTGVPVYYSFQIKTWLDFEKFYFPPAGHCYLTKIGPSGIPVNYGFACNLLLNRLYMIMFLFVHAWYVALTILAGTVLIYRIVLLIPSLRVKVMEFQAVLSDRSTLKSLCSRLSYSDCFFLSRFQRVMTDVDFAQMLEKISTISEYKSYDIHHDESNTLALCEEIQKEVDNSAATSPV